MTSRPATARRRARCSANVRVYVAGLVERTESSVPARCLRRFAEINGRERAFVLGAQAFTTVIPLLIVVSAAARSNGTPLVADRLTARFRLSGSAADALRTLFERPPGATGAITVVGVVMLLLSLVNLTRSLQRVFEEAWALPPIGVRGTLHGVTGFGLLLASVLVLSLLVSALRPLPAGTVLAAIVRVPVAGGVWLLLHDLLLSRRIAVRRLLPGALVAGVGQTVISLYSGLWMPRVISGNADRYGVIGVTFGMLSWLIVIGVAAVLLAVTGAELGGAPPRRPRAVSPPTPETVGHTPDREEVIPDR